MKATKGKKGLKRLKKTVGQVEAKRKEFMQALGMKETNLFDRPGKSGEETGIKQLFDGYGNEGQSMPKDENDYIKAMQKLAGQADDAVEAGAGKEPQKGERLLFEIEQLLHKKGHFLHKLLKHKHKKAEVERGVHRLEQAKEKLAQLFKSVPGLASGPTSPDTPEAFIEKTKKLAMEGHELVEKFGGGIGKKGGSFPDSEKGRVRSLLLQLEALANSKAQHEQVLHKDGAGHKKAELLRHVDRMQKVRETLEGMLRGLGGRFEVINNAPKLSLMEQLRARNKRA